MQNVLAAGTMPAQHDTAQTSARAATRRWLKVSILWFVLAVSLGVFMGASHDHRLMGVHVHINMLGWVSPALFAFAYQFFPAAATTRLAGVQFWLHNITLPVMMVALAFVLLGHEAEAGPVLGMTSMLMWASVLMFAFNVLRQRD
ncbi:MAG: hypothetical protein ACOY3X_09600 [Pseudomonadota bacterium]